MSKLTLKNIHQHEQILLTKDEMREWANIVCFQSFQLAWRQLDKTGSVDMTEKQREQDIEDIVSGKIETHFRGKPVRLIHEER